jgi:hypothetical protein
MFFLLVEEAEEPERNLVAEAKFDVVGGNKAIGDVSNLSNEANVLSRAAPI